MVEVTVFGVEGLVDMDVRTAQAIIDKTLSNALNQSKQHLVARNIDIVSLYSQGATLQYIGDKHGITREAVRQILGRLSKNTGGNLKEAVNTLKQEKKQAQEKALVEAAHKWSDQNIGSPLSEAETQLGVPLRKLRSILKDRLIYHPTLPVEGKEKSRVRWSDNELLALIRQCKEETGKITSQHFQEWSLERGGPTKQTPSLRFGSWSRAVKLAGVDGSYAVARKRAYQEEDLWASLIEYCSSPDYSSQVENYDRWQRRNKYHPSSALIRHRLGKSWSQLLSTALKVSQGTYQQADPSWLEAVCAPRNWKQVSERSLTEVDPDALIRQAIDEVGTYLTVSRYDRWAKARKLPVAVRLMARSQKSWSELVLPHGGRVGTRGRRGRMQDEEILAGLVQFLQTESNYSYEAYQVWAREHHFASPSMLTKRYKGFSRALALASQLLEERAGAGPKAAGEKL